MRFIINVVVAVMIGVAVQEQSPIKLTPQTGKGVITGKVKTSSGKPVIGEVIQLILLDSQERRKSGFESASLQMHLTHVNARTDDRGQYRLWYLPAGRYLVAIGRVSDQLIIGERKRYFRQTFYPGTTRESEARIVDLLVEQEAENVDITLGEDLPVYSISGVVLDETTKRPISGVIVGYQYRREGRQAYAAGPSTDTSGRFRIDGVAPGMYQLFVPDGHNTHSSTASVSFTLKDQSVSDLQIFVAGTVSLRGTATLDGIAQPGDAEVFSRLWVHLSRSSSTEHQPNFNVISINPDGTFQTNVLPGDYSFGSSISDPGMPKLKQVEINGVPKNGQFMLAAQSQPHQARLVFGRRTGKLKGQVVVPSHLQDRIIVTVTGVTLSSLPTIVGSDGSFQFDNLPVGECEVVARMSVNGKILALGRQKTTIQPDAVTTVSVALSEVSQ